MTKIKIVKTATVECIKPKDLKIGDYILWGIFKCKVIQIFHGFHSEKFAIIEQFLNEPESQIEIPKYLTFYKIIESEIIEEEIN